MSEMDTSENIAATPVGTEEDEDTYMEGPYLVFTAAYHRKRGYCCGSGCRHCPYDEHGNLVPGKGEALPGVPGSGMTGS